MQRDLEKEAQWRREFAEWKTSGLSGAAYCRQRGIAYSKFNDWQKKIRKLDAEALRSKKNAAITRRAASQPRPPAETVSAKSNADFAEVELVGDPVCVPPAPVLTTNSQIEIVLIGGITVRIHDQSSMDLLASVLSLLEKRRV